MHRKHWALLIAALALILPSGVAYAANAGNGGDNRAAQAAPEDRGPDEKGNACPPASPAGDEDRTPPPGCGQTDDEDDGDGDTGNACPPSSPNAGGSPPCGEDGDGDGDGEVDCEDPANADDPACDEGGATAQTCPQGALSTGTIDASPVATVCVTLGPADPETPEGERSCTNGALPVEVPADPVAFACVVLGPEAPEEEPAPEEGEPEGSTSLLSLLR